VGRSEMRRRKDIYIGVCGQYCEVSKEGERYKEYVKQVRKIFRREKIRIK